jgi:hypothetical protein
MPSPCSICHAPGANILGGVRLCRPCADQVRSELDAAHATGHKTTAAGIARRLYRERNPVSLFPAIMDFPDDLQAGIYDCLKRGQTKREFVIAAVREKVEREQQQEKKEGGK